MNIKSHILIVIHNEFDRTNDLINDLMSQDIKFNLTLVDNDSSDQGLFKLYDRLNELEYVNIIKNNFNKPLNHIWNDFYESTTEEYLVYLNNDIRIPSNFLSDNEHIFNNHLDVGSVIHSTNNPNYFNLTKNEYVILDEAWQGWDFAIRRDCYDLIPVELKWYSGDTFIFDNLIKKHKKKIAISLSSPILHHTSTTGRKKNINGILSKPDNKKRLDLGHASPARNNSKYTNVPRPSDDVINKWKLNYETFSNNIHL